MGLQIRENERGMRVVKKRRTCGRKRKRYSDAKGKFSNGTPGFAGDGANVQFQFSPNMALAPSLEKAKAPKINDNRRPKDRIYISFAESQSMLLARLLNAKFIKRIHVH